jgi:DnaJ family protein C protein 28
MKNRKRGIDEIIQNAINEGEFDQLPGKGKPLAWDEHSLVDDDWQLAHHLLKENGFAPDFIEARQSIESDLAAARAALKRAFDWNQKALASDNEPDLVKSQWAKAKSEFESRVGGLNKRIRDYNLTIPAQSFYRTPLDTRKELAKLVD